MTTAGSGELVGHLEFLRDLRHTAIKSGASRTDASPGPQAACLLWGTAFRVG